MLDLFLNGWSLYSINHTFFDSREEGEEFLSTR